MKTGIKTIAPATISLEGALNNILFFALNQPRVEIVLKTTDKSSSFSLSGYKDYNTSFIQNAIDFIFCLDIFKHSPQVELEITNRIPLQSGLGAHSAFFAALLKAMSTINKINLNHRELYKLIISTKSKFLEDINPGRLLNSLDGGCMFVDDISPEFYHRIYLPTGIQWIIYRSEHPTSSEFFNKLNTKTSIAKSIELILGLHDCKWELLEHGFRNTVKNISLLNFTDKENISFKENCLGVDYLEDYNLFVFCCNNSLKAEICYEILNKHYGSKQNNKKVLLLSGIDLAGTIKM